MIFGLKKKNIILIKLLLIFTLAMLAYSDVATSQDKNSGFPELSLSGLIDGRIASPSDQQSWFDKGLGKTRYGEEQNTFNIAEAALILDAQFTWDLSGKLHLQYTPEQTEPVDIVEAYLEYKSLTLSANKISARAGLLYPPVSLEHTDIAWTSPYSLTPSAINSWIGEEVKALTAEVTYEKRIGEHKVSLVGAIFGGNDTTTSLLAWRGWAMHDQKASYFQRYPLPPADTLEPGGIFYQRQAQWTEPHHEYDDNLGYYAGLNWDYLGLIRLQGLYYDNRGDPEVHIDQQYAWDVQFFSLGAVAVPFDAVELIAQYMTGNTAMGPDRPGENYLLLDFSSYYFMASYSLGKHRVSARYDNFETTDKNTLPFLIDKDQGSGSAYTLAYSFIPINNHRLMAEWLIVNSDRDNRPDIDLPVSLREDQWQLSYRFSF